MKDFRFQIPVLNSRILLLPLWLLAFTVSLFAADISEYRKSVAAAIYELNTIFNLDGENLSGSELKFQVAKSAQKIRSRLLKINKVEIDGTAVEPDNAWLNRKLTEIEKTAYTDSKREDLLNDAMSRLTTLEQKLGEVEKQITGERTKDQEKQKLQEILSRNDYQRAVKKEEKEKNPLQKWWESLEKALLEWLSSLFAANSGNKLPNSTGLSSLSMFLQVLIIGIALGIVGFVIYRFAPFLFGIKRKEKKKHKTRVILGETISADQDSADILSAADLLARNGDLRGAIRQGYIALLCELSDRKVIGLAQHKTNRDYLRDVRKNRPLHQNMDVMTNSFERHWYGYSDAVEQDWQEFRAKYRETIGSKQ